MQIPIHEVPVLIVGGGATGLAASILLSRLGMRSLLVERHVGTSVQPLATGLTTRTMELFRHWGIDTRIRDYVLDVDISVSRGQTLAGVERHREALGFPTADQARAVSPAQPVICSQEFVERALRDLAGASPLAELRFDTQLVSLSQDATGVDAVVRVGISGRESRIRAQYVVAADGVASAVRRHVGIPMLASTRTIDYLAVTFRASIDHLARGRRCAVYAIEHPDVNGLLVPTSRGGRWVLCMPYDPAREPRLVRDLPALADKVRTAVGVADLHVDVIEASTAQGATQVAERFRAGRVFLAGDAAHELDPLHGMGMGTGIQDVNNLAWKLAAVLQGWGGRSLLDTYESERRPVAVRNAARSNGALQQLSGLALDMGFGYVSSAVIGEPGAMRGGVDEPATVAAPGRRAPHFWLQHNGRRISSLDLFGQGFVLLAGPEGDAWIEAAAKVSLAWSAHIDTVVLNERSLGSNAVERWTSHMGLDPRGAVLVRPDGHVAWRSAGLRSGAVASMTAVVATVLGRDGEESRTLTGTVLHPAYAPSRRSA